MQCGAVIIIENEKLALIERVRAGQTYYPFPGGGVEAGETVEQAAVRKACEELGLQVQLGPLVAVVEHDGDQQSHFLAHAIRRVFGSGNGQEVESRADSWDGSYKPVRLSLCDLHEYDVRPKALAEALSCGQPLDGSQILHVQD